VDYRPNLPPGLKGAVVESLDAIDAVHRVPKAVRVTVAHNRKRRESGCYDPATRSVTISRLAPDFHGTALHEFGHFLDNRMLHTLSKCYASEYHHNFLRLMQLCSNSRPIQTIQQVLRKSSGPLSSEDRWFLEEAVEPYEIFARAYAQWICGRSGNSALRDSLAVRSTKSTLFAGTACVFYWDGKEVADIMNAIDVLFESKGLLC
jgi:hypothetical protein